MALITSSISTAIVAFAVTAVPALYRHKSQSVAAKTKEDGLKYIDLSSFYFWITYGGGTLFVVAGALVYLFSDEPIAGLFFALFGFLFVLAAIFLARLDTSVVWSPTYISGARSGYSTKKNNILWDDVEWIKYHPNHTIQIKGKSGKSIFWSIYQIGWNEIVEDLRKIRPDIDTSDFD